jgi:hypothetical protein
LINFIISKQDIDIFCFQEVYHKAQAKITDEAGYINLDIFSEIQSLLPNHTGYFRPVVQGIYGIAMFVKKYLLVIEEGEHIIHANDNYIGIGPTHSRILQYAKKLNIAAKDSLWSTCMGCGTVWVKEIALKESINH